MSIRERIEQLTRETKERIAEIQLLGEIDLSEDERLTYRQAVKDLFRERFDPCAIAPEVVAMLLVDVAKRRFDGRTFWPQVLEELAPPGYQDQQLPGRLGETFEKVVRGARLPTFEDLVYNDHALRFVCPIVAHAMVPQPLAMRFLDLVIKPAQERAGGGIDAEYVQRWLAADPPLGLTRQLTRFLIHGGVVAQDLIARVAAYAEARAAGEPDSGAGLPAWLRTKVAGWALSERGPAPRASATARVRSPRLRLDPAYGEVVLELPYQDDAGELEWEVAVTPPGSVARYRAFGPLWDPDRVEGRRRQPITEPYRSLRVNLNQLDGASRGTWDVPSPGDQAALFFRPDDCRVINPGAVLDGDSWYVLRPERTEITSDGQLRVIERLAPPPGWEGYTLDWLECHDATTLTLSHASASTDYRLRQDEVVPSRFVPGPSLGAFLRPLDADMLALEGALPRVFIPVRKGSLEADDRYLELWQLSASGAGVRHAVAARELQPRFDAALRGWLLRLDALIPGEDVGTWDVAVRGPLGLDSTARLALLPRGFTVFRMDERAALAGGERSAWVATRAGVTVLERDDIARHIGDNWELVDHNRNGRVPFRVQDRRSGRETSAVVVLPTVEWQWSVDGAPLGPWNSNQTVELDTFMKRTVALSYRSTTPVRVSLRCVIDGVPAQTVETPGGRDATYGTIPLTQIRPTVNGTDAQLARIEILVGPPESPIDSREVGAVVRPLVISGFSHELLAGGIRFRWRQSASLPGMRATLKSLWRPWEEVADADVEASGAARSVSFYVYRLGSYEFELFASDPWLGEFRVHSDQVAVGSPLDQRRYRDAAPRRADGRPPTARDLMDWRMERTFATPRGPSAPDLAVLGRTVLDEGVLDWLLKRLAEIAEQGSSPEHAAVAWWDLDLSAQPIAPAALFEAVARAPAGGSPGPLLIGLGVQRWKAKTVQDSVRGRRLELDLWARWPPLGAFVDLADDSQTGEQRCRDNLSPIHPREVNVAQAWTVVAGHLPRGRFVPNDRSVAACKALAPAVPPPLLSEPGFDVACLADLDRAKATGVQQRGEDWLRGVQPRLEEIAASNEFALGWDVAGGRRPPGAKRFELLPWAALTTAIWERRVARGDTADRPNVRVEACRRVAELARLVPATFDRDLCLAEAILEWRARRHGG